MAVLMRCNGCMREREAEEAVCPECGWNHATNRQGEGALAPGTVLHAGKYIVGRMLGQGGFGITYIGLDQTLNMKVAIKEYFPKSFVSRAEGSTTINWVSDSFDREGGRESFIREARNMAKINQISGVAQVRDIFYQNDTAYIVMNYVEGETLKAKLDRDGILSEEECLKLLIPVMNSLSEAHKAGMIHRDISPDNIMIDKNGKVWLMDLGAAKALDNVNNAQSTSLVIRHGFSPIEQFADAGKIGPWTDVYAMSATMYYCMSGKVLPDSLNRLSSDNVTFPDKMSPKLVEALKKGFALKPEDRIQSMDELIAALEDVKPASSQTASGASGKSGKPGKSDDSSTGKSGGKKKTGLIIGLVALLAAAIVGVVFGVMNYGGSGSGHTASSGHVDDNEPIDDDPETEPEPEPEVLAVAEYGTPNANIINSSGILMIEGQYEYFLTPDSSLTVVPYDTANQTFVVDTGTEVHDSVCYLCKGENRIYFTTVVDNRGCAVASMSPDGSDVTYLDKNDEARGYYFLQCVKLNDGREYLYYTCEKETGGLLGNLYRYDLQNNKTEILVTDDVFWFNVYNENVYFTDFVDGKFTLKYIPLDGGDAVTIDETKKCSYGFIEDDKMFLYSNYEESLVILDMQGNNAADTDWIYSLSLDYSRGFGYEEDWFYYVSASDGYLHRIRMNGTGDTLVCGKHTPDNVCVLPDAIWFSEMMTGKYDQQMQQMVFLTNRTGSFIYPAGKPMFFWPFDQTYARDYDYEDDTRPDGGVVITGYHGTSTEINIPDYIDGKPVTAIGDEAFKESAVEKVGLPESLTRIGQHAFYDSQISFIGMPDGLKSIEYSAFMDCEQLTSITLPSTMESIGELAFCQTSLGGVISIPQSVKFIGPGAFAVRNWNNLTGFNVASGNQCYFHNEAGALCDYYNDGYILLQYPSGRLDTEVTLDAQCLAIEKFAFAHCYDLTSVNVSGNLMAVAYQAFFNTNVTAITVPTDCSVNEDLGEEITVTRSGNLPK
ncbi:MAG: leucine-rich repeat protein [Lachnospiraceae bacterium]|nr:leucine-rich repeat protein [Lachnospiraceae bacterium]